MGAFVVDVGATILCPHGGTGTPVPTCTRVTVGGNPPLLQSDQVLIGGCGFNVSGAPSPCLQVQWLMPSVRVTFQNQPVVLSSSIGMCLNPAGVPQGPERSPDSRRRCRQRELRTPPVPPRAGACARRRRSRAPHRRPRSARPAHRDGERLHHPDFGAGLGAGALFEPLDPALLGIVSVRARGSLQQALGDRIDVVAVTVDQAGESTITASVTYRLHTSTTPHVIDVLVPR